MINRDVAIELMQQIDSLEADMRRIEHRLFALRDRIGKCFHKLRVGYYEEVAAKCRECGHSNVFNGRLLHASNCTVGYPSTPSTGKASTLPEDRT